MKAKKKKCRLGIIGGILASLIGLTGIIAHIMSFE